MGLLVLRLAAGIAAITYGVTGFETGASGRVLILSGLAIADGILLLAGLWTPVSGFLAGVLGFWNAVSQFGDPWAGVLLGTIGVALALLGPGAWSVDARLFGWRRIDVHNPKR